MSKNNLTFVKQTPKFLRELQESQEAVTAKKDAERERRSENFKVFQFEDEAPVVVNADDFDIKEQQLTETKNGPCVKQEYFEEKKKAKVLQNLQKRNKNLLSFDEDNDE
jgi:hypothetical protein